MDLHNNSIGIEIGLEYLNSAPGTYNLLEHLCTRLENGDLEILEFPDAPASFTSPILDSDECECD